MENENLALQQVDRITLKTDTLYMKMCGKASNMINEGTTCSLSRLDLALRGENGKGAAEGHQAGFISTLLLCFMGIKRVSELGLTFPRAI